MFENEYVMTRKRFDKWNTPKFWKDTPGFYVFTFLFVAGIFGWIYFGNAVEAGQVGYRWRTIGAFLTFVAVYRGVFFNWMRVDKMFRVTRQQYFNEKDYTCRILVRDKQISLFINGKLNNTIEWNEIICFEEAKTYFRLGTNEFRDGVMIDKGCFTEGDVDGFREYMKNQHANIPYAWVHPKWDW